MVRELSEGVREKTLFESKITALEKNIKNLKRTNIGSAQKFMKGYKNGIHFPRMYDMDRDEFLDSVGKVQSERWYMFDTLIANTDRHNNNWMYKREASKIPGIPGELKIALIDNGLTLPSSGGYSLRIPGHLEDLFDDKPISADCLDRIDKFVENKVEITKRLQEVGLDDKAIKGLFDRAQELQDMKRYPVRGVFSEKKVSRFSARPSDTTPATLPLVRDLRAAARSSPAPQPFTEADRLYSSSIANIPLPSSLTLPSVTKLKAKKKWDLEDFEYMKEHIARLRKKHGDARWALMPTGVASKLPSGSNNPKVKKIKEEWDRAKDELIRRVRSFEP